MIRLSEKDFASLSMKLAGNKLEHAREGPRQGNKYKNKKVYVYSDGFVGDSGREEQVHGKVLEIYDSIKEYNRASELRLMEKAGLISGLGRQERLIIEPAFVDSDGVRQQAVSYRADFSYYDSAGRHVVEDVKGYDQRRGQFVTTPVFNLKWKLLKKKYPGIVFKIV